ncbi:MAG: hypothetical protein Q4D26_12215 [Clostridia bacterium]|nr:hypothetical protein [Clostridia bacterium]
MSYITVVYLSCQELLCKTLSDKKIMRGCENQWNTAVYAVSAAIVIYTGTSGVRVY